MLFDSHAHLTDRAFDADRETLIASLKQHGVTEVLCPSVSVSDARQAKVLAHSYPGIYFAAGVHPEEILSMERSDLDLLANLAQDPKCVAIGEIGLDYHYGSPEERDTQRYWFYQQLSLAKSLNLPVIIHDREAHQPCFDAVTRFGVRGVFHCFSSSAEMALQLISFGLYCSFNGVITYRNAKRALRAVEALPLERILIETDSPYLTPAPNVKERNTPANIVYVAEKIAQIKGVSVEDVAKITAENAHRLFRIE